MDFRELISQAHGYLNKFDRTHYAANYAVFKDKLTEYFQQDNETDGEELLRLLTASYTDLGKFERNKLSNQDKMVLALFFSPAAREISNPALACAEKLNEAWNQAFPKNTYILGNYQDILKGFQDTFFNRLFRK